MDIATRMKENYELRQRPMLTRRVPVIVRVDGRAFHTYTRTMNHPYDDDLHAAMLAAAYATANDMQGCKAVYIQSDEASFLLTDYSTLTTEAWFDYNQSKLCSVSASLFTAKFNQQVQLWPEARRPLKLAHFDARAFNMPREEVVNYFLWRMMDWTRNSVSMLTRAHYSPTEMHGASVPDMHEMLHEKGINWATMQDWERNGTWLVSRSSDRWYAGSETTAKYSDIEQLLSNHIYPLITGEDDGSTDPTRAGTADSISESPGPTPSSLGDG